MGKGNKQSSNGAGKQQIIGSLNMTGNYPCGKKQTAEQTPGKEGFQNPLKELPLI